MAYALTVWAVWIAWDDWRRRKIANASLILVFAPACLSLVLLPQGLLGASAKDAGLGFALALAVTVPGYALGMLGAGDAKYAATLGLLLGLGQTLWMLLVFALLLGALSAWLFWRADASTGLLKRRFAAAPALSLAFCSQLWMPQGVLSG